MGCGERLGRSRRRASVGGGASPRGMGARRRVAVSVGRGWYAAGVQVRRRSCVHQQAAAQHLLGKAALCLATAQARRSHPPECGFCDGVGRAAERGAPRLKPVRWAAQA